MRQTRRAMPAPALAVVEAPRPSLVIRVKGEPVSANSAYANAKPGKPIPRIGRDGRVRYVQPVPRYLTRAAQGWRDQVAQETRLAMVLARQHPNRMRRPFHVVCTFYGSRADADNLLKMAIDGVKIGLQIDDRYFAHIEARSGGREGGEIAKGVRIEVYEAPVPSGNDEPPTAA